MSSETIEEIKSRRIAIARHQRDLAASVEVLRGLTNEERDHAREYSKSRTDVLISPARKDSVAQAMLEIGPAYNRGRSNGLVTGTVDGDSWERIY